MGTNQVWQSKLKGLLEHPHFVASPRGLKINEELAGTYQVRMPAFLDLVDRKVNVGFMFAEAAWILSGSNRVSEITPFMKAYGKFSDDGVFMNGGYGPKVVDQLGWAANQLVLDPATRQAYINIWREKPGVSKDIPCTTGMQFLIRHGMLHMVVTMRSNDIIKGFTYDVFTFSMIATALSILLEQRGLLVSPGTLTVTAGSLHLYHSDYEQSIKWLKSNARDLTIEKAVKRVIVSTSYDDLVTKLWTEAKNQRR